MVSEMRQDVRQVVDQRRGYDTLQVSPLTPVIGAEISGIDLSCQLSNNQVADIRDAFHAHSVLVFRDQQISRDEHKRFARHFGP